jgi:hypothetical protein
VFRSHESHSGVVHQERALPAHRLTHQRLLAVRSGAQRRQGSNRRVELHELQIAHYRTRT